MKFERVSQLLMMCVLGIAILSTTAVATTMDYVGTWNSATTYVTGKVVKYNGTIFYSLKSTSSAPNKNKTPDTNPAWWEKVGTTISSRSVYDSTGKLIGPLVGENGLVGISIGNILVPLAFNDSGFAPECWDTSCIPINKTNYGGYKVFETTNCSGTAYYFLNWSSPDLNNAKAYGVSSGNRFNSPVTLSVDIYTPSNLVMKTISSVDNGGCKRLDVGLWLPTPSMNLIVSDGTFLKTTVSGFTPQFYVK